MSLLPISVFPYRTGIFLLLSLFLSACANGKQGAVESSGQEQPANAVLDSESTRFVGVPSIPDIIDSYPEAAETMVHPSFTVEVDRVPARTFLQALARDANLELLLTGSIKNSVSMVMHDRSLPEILDNVAAQASLRYVLDDHILRVFDDVAYMREYPVDYLNMRRNANSSIRLSTQLDSISVSLDGGSAGLSSANNSDSTIKNVAVNNFWESLEANLRSLVSGRKINADDYVPVIVNREAGVLIVSAKHSVHQEIEQFLESVQASVQKQVLIEALVVEVSLNKDFQAGIDWRILSAGDKVHNFSQNLAGHPLVTAETLDEISAPSVLLSMIRKSANGAQISATLALLEQFGNVKILSSPKINALNNQAAVLKVVDNKVYFTVGVQRVKVDDEFEKLTTTTDIKTVPVGLVMNVVPYISRENSIILNVRPTISRILGFVSDPNPDLASAGIRNMVPEIQVREMESVLRVNDGGMVVIGGLMQERTSKEKVGVPLLSDIPILGSAFRFERDKTEKTELLVFLKPTVIGNQSNYKREIQQYLN